MSSLSILNVVLPIFGLVALGAVLRYKDWLQDEADSSLTKLVLNVLYPSLILDSLLGNKALLNPQNLLISPMLGFALVFLGCMVARWTMAPWPHFSKVERRTFSFVTGMFNYGYIPIPLIMMLFDRETLGVLMVFNLGVEIGLWVTGLVVLGGMAALKDWRKLVNMPLAMIVFGIIFSYLGGAEITPAWMRKLLNMLGNCSIPMVLLLVGATMMDLSRTGNFLKNGMTTLFLGCVVRLGILPIIFVTCAYFIPGSTELKRVLVIQAAMPCAIFPVLMSKHYGGDVPTALRVAIGTSLAGLLTIPLWLQWGISLLNLNVFHL